MSSAFSVFKGNHVSTAFLMATLAPKFVGFFFTENRHLTVVRLSFIIRWTWAFHSLHCWPLNVDVVGDDIRIESVVLVELGARRVAPLDLGADLRQLFPEPAAQTTTHIRQIGHGNVLNHTFSLSQTSEQFERLHS